MRRPSSAPSLVLVALASYLAGFFDLLGVDRGFDAGAHPLDRVHDDRDRLVTTVAVTDTGIDFVHRERRQHSHAAVSRMTDDREAGNHGIR